MLNLFLSSSSHSLLSMFPSSMVSDCLLSTAICSWWFLSRTSGVLRFFFFSSYSGLSIRLFGVWLRLRRRLGVLATEYFCCMTMSLRVFSLGLVHHLHFWCVFTCIPVIPIVFFPHLCELMLILMGLNFIKLIYTYDIILLVCSFFA